MSRSIQNAIRRGALSGFLVGLTYALFAGAVMAFRNALGVHPRDILLLLLYLVLFYGTVGALCLGAADLLLSRIPFFGERQRFGERFPWLAGIGAALLVLALLRRGGHLPGRLSFLASLPAAATAASAIAAGAVVAGLAFILVRILARRAILSVRRVGPALGGVLLIALSVGYVGTRRGDGEAGGTVVVDPDADPPKLLLIGLDGATWEVLEPLMEAGRLPNLRMLVETGTSGPLRSMRPTKSPIIWTSIATGKDYLRHGITDFVVYPVPGLRRPLSSFPFCPGVEETIRAAGISTIPITSTLRSEKAFWNILSENGRAVGVIGWWGSWPVEPVSGFMVSDRVLRWSSGEYGDARAIVYPDSLFEEISERIQTPDAIAGAELSRFVTLPPEALEAVVRGEYPSDGALPERSLELLKVSYNTDRWKSAIGGYLRERYDPDVFAIYFAGIDAAEHGFWKWRDPEWFPDVPERDVGRYGDVIDEYCVYVDGLIGTLVRSAGEEVTVLIFSDHGHHVNRSWRPGSAQFGAHEDAPDGIFIAWGKDIRSGYRVRGASIYDVLPTLLYAAGLPTAADLEGRVLREIFEEGRLNDHPPATIASYGARTEDRTVVRSDADGEVKERLKALGYLQ